MDQYKKDFIEFMVGSKVLTFGDFVLKSGRRSPFFINTGNYSTGSQLEKLGRCYAEALTRNMGGGFNVLFGPAYKGIPLASACATALWDQHQIDKPYFFNRKEEKDHGEGGSTVGYTPVDGDRIIIIEDVITAGTAIREVMPILQSFGNVQVGHMFITVDRMEYGQVPGKTAVMEVAEDFGLLVSPIVNVGDIREWLVDSGRDADDVRRMDEYMEEYCVRG